MTTQAQLPSPWFEYARREHASQAIVGWYRALRDRFGWCRRRGITSIHASEDRGHCLASMVFVPYSAITSKMATDVFAEILQWSAFQPLWQRDALRSVLTVGTLTSTDLDAVRRPIPMVGSHFQTPRTAGIDFRQEVFKRSPLADWERRKGTRVALTDTDRRAMTGAIDYLRNEIKSLPETPLIRRSAPRWSRVRTNSVRYTASSAAAPAPSTVAGSHGA